MTLKQIYCRYLEKQVPGSQFLEDLSTNGYLCWSIPHYQKYQIHNWMGKQTGYGFTLTKRYVWVGKKGAIYVTKTPKFEKNQFADNGIVLKMKMAQQSEA